MIVLYDIFILMLEKLFLFNVDHFHKHNFKVILKNVHKLFSEFLCQLVHLVWNYILQLSMCDIYLWGYFKQMLTKESQKP